MQRITQVLKKLELISGTQIDRSYGQGREAVVEQLSLRIGKKEEDTFVDQFIASCQKDVEDIKLWVKPAHLPKDYVVFLENYGGLIVEAINYTLIINGIGPMVEEWYGFLMGDEVFADPSRDGLVYIGDLSIRPKSKDSYPRIMMFIDIAGVVRQYSILGIGPWVKPIPGLADVLSDFAKYPEMWKILAKSFTQLLELIVETEGTLGYL